MPFVNFIGNITVKIRGGMTRRNVERFMYIYLFILNINEIIPIYFYYFMGIQLFYINAKYSGKRKKQIQYLKHT